MLALQLYIENKQVDLYDDESVTLVQSIQDVRDIEKVFTDFTRTFSIPASKTNNKIFQHFYNYHIIGFDARKKKEAKLFLNNELFKEGKIKLEGVTRKNNKAHTYKITFYGNGVNLKDLLGEDKIDSLSQIKASFNFNYNDTNIKSYLANGLDVTVGDTIYQDAIIFPLISHTKRLIYDSGFSGTSANSDTQNNIAYESAESGNHGLQISQLKPAIRVYPIIKAIENDFNITFSDDFFTTENEPFYNLYLWMHNKTGGLFVDDENETPVGSFEVNDVNGSVLDLYDNYFVTPKPHQEGTKRGKAQRILDVSIYPSVADEFTFTIYRNGSVFEQYANVSRDTDSLRYEIRDLNIDAGKYTFTIESATPSTYNIDFYVKRKKNIGGGYRDVHFSGTAEVLSDVQINTSKKLPDIKIIDFLTSLFKMFNLTSFQNADGTIEVKTLDAYYSESSKIWNITEYLDKTESAVDNVLPYKQVDFGYEGLDNFFAKNHNELFNAEWGSEYYTATDVDKIEGEVYTVKIPLEHFKYERLQDIADSTFKDLLWGWSADIKQQPNLGKPLLFYPISQTQSIGVINSDGSVDEQTQVYIPSNSIRLTDSKTLNFSAEPNEYLGTPFKKTLFTEYYQNYIKEIFDPQRRLTTIKAYLPLSMLVEYTLADKIQVFDGLYKINKITTNFETKQSSLELINIKAQAGETIEDTVVVPDKFVPNSVCFTADRTDIFADNFVITADADCDVEGLEIKSTTEIIPNAVDTGNKVQVVDHSIPVPVTPAIIELSAGAFTNNTSTIFSAFIDKLGRLGGVTNWDEYGVFWSTDINKLISDDYSVLASDSSLNLITVESTKLNQHEPLKYITLQVTGLTSNTTYYYKAFIKTNVNSNYNTGDETIAMTKIGFRKTTSRF
jgi:hypothetical protein